MPKRAGVTCRFEPKVEPYASALRIAGVEPVLISPGLPIPPLSSLAGLLISGGTDIDPAIYGADRDPHTGEPDMERDILEQQLLREALEADLPVLAICRGMQLLNVSHDGGTLLQHIENHEVRTADPSRAVHEIEVKGNTKLAAITESERFPVNSRHHQAAGIIGRNLIVSARARDGIVEALERPDRRFVVAVQWHPEDQTDRPSKRLFEAFADAL